MIHRLAAALAARAHLLFPPYETAVRLFNGFSEGEPDLVVELYGCSLVFFDRSSEHLSPAEDWAAVVAWYLEKLPWLKAVLVKTRNTAEPAARNGQLLFGQVLDSQVREGKALYALDLRLNQDSSFYIDARELRAWLAANMSGKRVLNTFAYTGSLGVAALAGGARRVVQTDRTARFLALARQTCRLNGWWVDEKDFIVGDFYRVCARLKQSGALFDCVILDPPVFSSGSGATVDLVSGYARLVNKLRPLVADGGWIVAVNNALFVSGAVFLAMLEHLCTDGYLQIETLIPVPPDVAGYPGTITTPPLVDPAPFNHPTKIAVLRVRRKDGRVE